MCDVCAEETQKSTQHKSSRRKKLWEVESILACPILGTCLSMEDLRKVVRQCGITFEERPSDYDLHTTMVAQANRKGKASRYMHRMMDRKYDRWIQLLAHCRESAELERYWQAALDSGDIPGNYWAIMTHPYSSDDLIFRMFGDVHMLSHLQGASNRADLKRLKNLESDVVELQQTLKKQRKKHNEQIQHRDEIIRRQEQELLALMVQRTKQQQQASIDTSARGYEEYESLVRQTNWLEERLAAREAQMAEQQQEIRGLKELLDETRREHAAMEQTMTSLLSEDEQREKNHIGNVDLSGKRILYVGGRSKLAPHLRALVERHNGHFDHHDDGLENSRGGLECNLTGADMVFCPVDCISHDACLRVKRHCQQQAKQFIPLRTSGISAFAAGLRQFSAVVSSGEMEIEQ